ncbi:MAG: phosphoribosylanthranilate isomerase [Deltaproteobacteria bacterium]|nr:phosphoribosylanthranilate isomerase [Deltaproteobacteria bacterium]
MSFLIKICGITTAADAAMAAHAGADAIGVNFWPGSKRFVGDAAADVLAAVPAGVLKIGVFVNAPAAEVMQRAAQFALDRIQLHGDERPKDFSAVPRAMLVRAIRVRDATSLVEAALWDADLFLYDAFVAGFGGGGVVAPWAEIGAAPAARPFLLAGGLDEHNVGQAVAIARPAGVDVASGVESAPGRKDPARVIAFVRAARAAADLLLRAGSGRPHS